MPETPEEGEKPHDPTPRRLEQARQRGDVLRSSEIGTAMSWTGFVLMMAGFGPWAVERLGQAGAVLLDQADSLAPQMLQASSPLAGLILRSLTLALPFLVVPLLLVLLASVPVGGLRFSSQKLRPDLSRLSPWQNAGRKFGRAGLFDFLRNLLKMGIVALLLTLFLAGRLPQIIAAAGLPPRLIGPTLVNQLTGFLLWVLAVTLCLAGLDLLWQHHERLRRLRMSRQELLEEIKETEGDPLIKGQRRQRGRDIALNRMLAEVRRADVVIVNPTHVAVALAWRRGQGHAPRCVAKGVDAVALRIRAVAAEAGVPIRHDPPTARALHDSLKVGDEIRRIDFAAVAAAIRFAERMRRRARARSGG